MPDSNIIDEEGASPLHWAAANGWPGDGSWRNVLN